MEMLNEKVSRELVRKIRHLSVQVTELSADLPDEGQFQYARVADLLRMVRAEVTERGASVLQKHMLRMLDAAASLKPRDWWPKSLQAHCNSLHDEMCRLVGMADLIAMITKQEKEADEIDYSAE
jgi:hypothetical protein